jgi:hypothetical protein
MKPTELQRVLLRPVSLTRSLAVSRRVRSRGGKLLPVVMSASTRFELAREAVIETDGSTEIRHG